MRVGWVVVVLMVGWMRLGRPLMVKRPPWVVLEVSRERAREKRGGM